jgi:hypothetical protein
MARKKLSAREAKISALSLLKRGKDEGNTARRSRLDGEMGLFQQPAGCIMNVKD